MEDRRESEAYRRMSVNNPNVAALKDEAQDATEAEHNLTIRDALKLYPKAVMFSVAFSTAVIMEGYDLALIDSFFGFGPFKEFYGTEVNPENRDEKVIGAGWQSGIKNAVQVRLQVFWEPGREGRGR